jgi:hypothetical protein
MIFPFLLYSIVGALTKGGFVDMLCWRTNNISGSSIVVVHMLWGRMRAVRSIRREQKAPRVVVRQRFFERGFAEIYRAHDGTFESCAMSPKGEERLFRQGSEKIYFC